MSAASPLAAATLLLSSQNDEAEPCKPKRLLTRPRCWLGDQEDFFLQVLSANSNGVTRGCHVAELWFLLLIFPSLTLPGVTFSLSPLCPSFFCIWLLEGQLGQRHRTDPNAIRHRRMFTGSMQTSADLGILEVLETEAWLYWSSRFTNYAIVSMLHWCHKSAVHPCAAELLCLLTHRTAGAVAPVEIVMTLQARRRVSSLWS